MSDASTWGFWTFVATAIYAFVSFLQWRAISRTATLTETTVQKTTQAVDAANRNATAAFQSAIATKDMAEAAKVSAMAAIAAVEHADRPWLHVSLKVLNLENRSDGIFVVVNLRITNVGHSAALRVQVSVDAKLDDDIRNPMEEVMRLVNAPRPNELGGVVFPTDHIFRRFEITVPNVVREKSTVPLVIFGGIRYTHGETMPRRQVHTTTFGYVMLNELGQAVESSPRGFDWAE